MNSCKLATLVALIILVLLVVERTHAYEKIIQSWGTVGKNDRKIYNAVSPNYKKGGSAAFVYPENGQTNNDIITGVRLIELCKDCGGGKLTRVGGPEKTAVSVKVKGQWRKPLHVRLEVYAK